MKIQCDVCEKAPATVICCADEAALCARCDVQVHKANKLASKHQRLPLHSLSSANFPRCDICQEKAAFIFCVEDRALFCRDCDEPIHVPGSLSGNHQRLLATGIRVALSGPCVDDSDQVCLEPPASQNPAAVNKKPIKSSAAAGGSVVDPFISQQHREYPPPENWTVNELLQLSDFEANDKKESLAFGELEWITDIGLFDCEVPQEAVSAAQVPQISSPSFSPNASRPPKSAPAAKKARLEIDPDDFFTVPDLGNFGN
ncbi:B-box zinc finger protein 25-like [Nymphaea colorata]|nr:B-box zinc finger protein 25-like [Nymphaea colorata]